MKRSQIIAILILASLMMVTAIVMIAWQNGSTVSASPNAWFWTDPKPLQQVFLGDFDKQMIVVEGQIGNQVSPPEWNIYLFGDGGAFDIRANFADNMPSSALPKNTTVRLIGVPNNGEMAVEGLEIMGSSSAQPDATIAQINSGSLDGQDVAVRGQVGNQIDANWKYYDFHDNTGTAVVDFEDNLSLAQTPRDRQILVYGEVKPDGGNTRRIDNDTILLTSDGGGEPTETPTSGPTATATDVPPTVTPITPVPSATPDPSLTEKTYLPVAIRDATQEPPGNEWVWETTNTVAQINGGCCNQQVVVVEGQITGKNNSNDPDWNEYNFSDGSGTVILDFEDEIPSGAIPQNSTVRIIGQEKTGNYRKIDVFGLQTLGNISATASHNVTQIASGCCDEQEVSVQGSFLRFDSNYPGWMVYDFGDGVATTQADLENSLLFNHIPLNRPLLLYGKGDDFFFYGGSYKINARLMLFAGNVD